MDDDEIDYSDIPPLTEDFFKRAKLVLPNAVELDSDVLSWFKHQGHDYSAHINRVLREYMALHMQT
ncbi:MAG: BrnA antitoxin family protein [Oscillochloridaceae bacterium umkhey_bin13]